MRQNKVVPTLFVVSKVVQLGAWADYVSVMGYFYIDRYGYSYNVEVYSIIYQSN